MFIILIIISSFSILIFKVSLIMFSLSCCLHFCGVGVLCANGHLWYLLNDQAKPVTLRKNIFSSLSNHNFERHTIILFLATKGFLLLTVLGLGYKSYFTILKASEKLIAFLFGPWWQETLPSTDIKFFCPCWRNSIFNLVIKMLSGLITFSCHMF